MKEFLISQENAGRRLDKYITSMVNAPVSFIYKMLRKKNIILNGHKASGNEILNPGDTVRMYISDDTLESFMKIKKPARSCEGMMPPVVYEDENVLIVDKPAGMLSQKASGDDISLNEICLSYVEGCNDVKGDTAFTPSICNRLDRNTSGLITFAKTYRAARILAEAFANRTVHKYYNAVATGRIDADIDLEGSLVKDRKKNTVSVYEDRNEGAYINTKVHPVSSNGKLTLVEILLVTGKTHQIRAHLASAGHPLLGDNKYGNRELNRIYAKKFGIKGQMLVCSKMIFPDDLPLDGLAGRTVTIKLPEEFNKVF